MFGIARAHTKALTAAAAAVALSAGVVATSTNAAPPGNASAVSLPPGVGQDSYPDYTCRIAGVDHQAVAVKGVIDLAYTWPLAAEVPATGLDLTVTLPKTLQDRFAAIGGKTLEGAVTGPVSLDGAPKYALSSLQIEQDWLTPEKRDLWVSPIDIPKVTLPDAGAALVLKGSGTLPTFAATGATHLSSLPGFPTADITELTYGAFRLQLILRNASGTPIRIDEPGIDGGGEDSDPDTFDVDCVAAATRPTILATITTHADAPAPPTAIQPTDADISSTSATIRWGLSPDDGTDRLDGYSVAWGDESVRVEPGTNFLTVSNLEPGKTYRFSVRSAKASAESEWVQYDVTTDVPSVRAEYSAKGTVAAPKLVKGDVAVSGSLVAESGVTAPNGFDAKLTLGNATARLRTEAAWLPIAGKLVFAFSGPTKGRLEGNVLTLKSKVRIKVTGVKTFGTIPLNGGNNCQTRQLSDLTLTSTAEGFSPSAGGTVTGSFRLSDLNGCAPLAGLLSPLTASDGNTISLTLKPTVATPSTN